MTTNISSLQNRQLAHSTPPGEEESRELAEVLQRIVQNAGALLEVNNCSVALSNATGTTVVTRAALRNQGRTVRHTTFQLNEGVAGWVAEHRRSLIINNVHLDPRFKRLGRTPIGSMICVPLIDHNNFVGALTASSPEVDAFSARQLQMLTIFAEQAVLAITNARHVAELRDAAQMKAKFLSMVTHELRSPLNTINGYLDLVLTGVSGDLNEQQREFVQRARAGSEHLYALVEDLLLISRADAGQLRLNREETSLQEIIANAVEELELTATDNNITVTINIAKDIPLIYADSVRLQQVLRNLLSNALRFTPASGSITIAARRTNNEAVPLQDAGDEGEWVEVSVRDTGSGVPAEYQQRIFERFYQVPRAGGGRPGGQGLGLAIVKMIVELHDGHIAVESIPDQGSTFSFRLPLP